MAEDNSVTTVKIDGNDRLVVKNALGVQATVLRRRFNGEVNPKIKELIEVSLNDVLRLQARF